MPPSTTRRTLLKSSAVFSTFSILPARLVRGYAANESVAVGCIGVGGQGGVNRKELEQAGARIVALCDVDAKRLAAAAGEHPDASQWADFREMLEKEQHRLDAVMVSTPDHTHAPASLLAMSLGKHVSTEKPLTHSVAEARAMGDAARKYNVATQLDNEGHASDRLRTAVEWVRGGAVGIVSEVHVWTNRPIWPQGLAQRLPEKPAPEHLNWDLWIGPAPMRAYHESLHPFAWRGWWDFGTGALGDIGCHSIDIPFWALELGGAVTVEAEHERNSDETFPNWSIVTYRFPQRTAADGSTLPPVTLKWYDGGKKPARPEELPAGEELREGGLYFVGEKGKLFMSGRDMPRLLPEARAKEYQPREKTLPRPKSHKHEWLEACKGGPKSACDFAAYGGPLTETVLLGNIAIKLGKTIEWDSKAFKITNAPEADSLLRREYRKGWEVF